ncbi:MAG: hypothetical protein DMG21_12240 [Acidobacteria bacterium]|nr:MAG: hypothetical protein DMG21_12240 [Acidobacteriota bacterium]
METQPLASASPPFSKRAARRMIQRAFVLAGRERNVRQHIRETRLTTLWRIEDWELSWTVFLDRGRIALERRPAKHPELTLTWPTAEEFFLQVEAGPAALEQVEREGDISDWRTVQIVLKTFFDCLREVLRDPVDENGDPLI